MDLERCRDLIFLTSTDTMIGFVSQSSGRLTQVKHRPPGKHYITALPSLASLKTLTRVPEKYKNHLRRARRSTFVFPNGHSYRIIRESEHHALIQKLGWAYTTSANISDEAFDIEFAREAADIIVDFPSGHGKQAASRIFKINYSRLKRLR